MLQSAWLEYNAIMEHLPQHVRSILPSGPPLRPHSSAGPFASAALALSARAVGLAASVLVSSILSAGSTVPFAIGSGGMQ